MRFKFILLMMLVMLVIVSTSVYAANSCRDCHENSRKMASLGYGHFAVSQKEVEAQSRMPAGCSECHLGNPARVKKDAAHQGMARLCWLYVKKG